MKPTNNAQAWFDSLTNLQRMGLLALYFFAITALGAGINLATGKGFGFAAEMTPGAWVVVAGIVAVLLKAMAYVLRK